jgi:hypothetical protein
VKEALMDDFIVAAIQRRLKTKLTDLGGGSRARRSNPADVASDEQRLGFSFPPLLKRIYAEIGNGGFGPGYGLIGFTNGAPDDTGKTGPAIYEQFQGVSADEPNWKWPSRLLPVCHWGCAILSCVDCADENFRMRMFDPNVYDGSDWNEAFFDEAPSFAQWIGDWASGTDLWKAMYGDEGPVTRFLAERASKR